MILTKIYYFLGTPNKADIPRRPLLSIIRFAKLYVFPRNVYLILLLTDITIFSPFFFLISRENLIRKLTVVRKTLTDLVENILAHSRETLK